jgi:hypothetical protein
MPGPQTDAYDCPLEDLFYGGARFGGKSQLLLGDFGDRARRFGSKLRGVLFRRTYDELTDIIEESKKLYGRLGWTYNETAHIWRSPNGATLFLRYLDRDADAEHYKGWNLQWLGFDEMDQWPDPRPIDKLWATLRSTEGVPCVRRCTGNPGGPGHAWIKKRYRPHLWKRGGKYIYTRYRPQPDEAPDLYVDAVYIPANLEDNVLVDHAEYEGRLAAATAGNRQLFRAWRSNDWDVLAGAYFDIFERERHVVETKTLPLEPWNKRWLSGDWGFNDETAIYRHIIDDNRHIHTYGERIVNHTIAPEIGRLILEDSQTGTDERGEPVYEKLSLFPFAPDAFKPGAERTIADEIGDVLRPAGLPFPTKAIDDRVSGWQLLYQLLATDYWTISPACPYLIESLPLMLRDEDNVNDIAPHPMDHGPDAVRYGLKTWLSLPGEPAQSLANKMITAADPTARSLQHMKAEAFIEKANRPAKFRRKRLY